MGGDLGDPVPSKPSALTRTLLSTSKLPLREEHAGQVPPLRLDRRLDRIDVNGQLAWRRGEPRPRESTDHGGAHDTGASTQYAARSMQHVVRSTTQITYHQGPAQLNNQLNLVMGPVALPY